jgi:predicted acetyltransferase
MKPVTLAAATVADASLLERLLELYCYDLSEVFGLEVDGQGRYGYAQLPLYWSEPGRRFAFLIHAGASIAGFALVVQGSPISTDPACHDMAEFFVLRRHRRSGVGRQAVLGLFRQFAGPWTVRVAEQNQKGCGFWSCAIADFPKQAYSVQTEIRNGRAWTHHAFHTQAAAGISA